MTRLCLVVEDESPLGEMICDNLCAEGYEAELVTDGAVAEERIQRGGFDLILLDVMLPGLDGFSILERMRKRGDPTPVLVVSARGADADRIRGLELQADDYLAKPFNLRELMLRVGALMRRAPSTEERRDLVEFGGNRIDLRAHHAWTWNGLEVDLTPSEVRLLRFLVASPRTVLPRAEIIRYVLGPATPPSTRTIDNLVLRLRKLFERNSRRPRHIHTVRGVGLRFVPDPTDRPG